MNKIFDKAYQRLIETYAKVGKPPDMQILSRFFSEKAMLQNSALSLRYLAFIGTLRDVAEQKGEHITIRGTAAGSLIAYLLGATDTNPLPRFVYCPCCHATSFIGTGCPLDHIPGKCECGADMVTDGYDIPFASNLASAYKQQIQIGVSYAFFEQASRMIYEEMWDMAIVMLRDQSVSPTWFCFLDREENDDGDYALSGNTALFENLPRITLVPLKTLDKLRELEQATGKKSKDIGQDELRSLYPLFASENLEGIPDFDNKFLHDLMQVTTPHSYAELLKLIGFAHSTCVWTENAEILFDNQRATLDRIPAYREELFTLICQKLYSNGIYETGFAYEVMEKARRGDYARNGGMDKDTKRALLTLGFDTDFLSFLEKIRYMFPKAHGVAYLKQSALLMFYKAHDPQTFATIMKEE